MHPLDRIGINIRRRHFDRCGQVDNGFVIWSWLPNVINRITYLFGIFKFGAGI